MITSGSTRGAARDASNMPRPRKRPNRASTNPAMVPAISAMVADAAAIRSDSHAASSKAASFHSVRYQRVENPPQTVTSREPLKLNATRNPMGA